VSTPAAASPQAVAVVPSPVPAPTNHFALALYNQRIGNYDEALSHYRALLAQGDSAEIHNNIGLISVEQGRLDEAVREYQRAIALDPKYVKAHNNLGVVYMRMNRGSDAASELRVALSIDPRNVESIVNLALVQKAAGRLADARDLLRRAVAIDPSSAGSHYNLAVFADESGDRASAIEHYRAFLKYGSVTHAELVATVRARLAALAS
jgi:Tfp pilus assembly protein PilF